MDAELLLATFVIVDVLNIYECSMVGKHVHYNKVLVFTEHNASHNASSNLKGDPPEKDVARQVYHMHMLR